MDKAKKIIKDFFAVDVIDIIFLCALIVSMVVEIKGVKLACAFIIMTYIVFFFAKNILFYLKKINSFSLKSLVALLFAANMTLVFSVLFMSGFVRVGVDWKQIFRIDSSYDLFLWGIIGLLTLSLVVKEKFISKERVDDQN